MIVGSVIVAGLGFLATVRIGMAGYRQKLTEARMSEIAVAIQAWESDQGRRCQDISQLFGVSISEEMFVDARLRVEKSQELQTGAYRVGDFIFAPPSWSGDPERSHVLGWTDPLDGYRIMVLRDGRTRSMSPRDWEKLESSGILEKTADSP